MTITAKPAAGTYSLNTGHSHFPSHLYMFDEGSGTTLTDQGSATAKTLTFGATTGAGPDWATDPVHGPVLTFVAANEDYAENSTISGLSGTQTAAFLVDLDAGVGARVMGCWLDPTVSNRRCFLVYQGDEDIEASSQFNNSLVTSTSTQDGTGDWDFVAVRFSDSSIEWSLNGSNWTAAAVSNSGLIAAITRFSVGAVRDPAPDSFFDDQMGAVFWWNADKDNSAIAAIYNGGDIWSGMGINPISVKKRRRLLMGVG